MRPIADWLISLELAQYTQAFVDNDIDLAVLPSLFEQDLKELGVTSMGHRKKMFQAIRSMADASAPSQQSDGEALTPITPEPPLSAVHPHTANAYTQGAERRQLTVMFCDMVGFTALASSLDPEVLQKVIRTYEEACAVCITRFDGYVFRRLGDGIIAFFGYPLAHESEAERAVRAALAIIDALARLEVPAVGRIDVRIGVATGVVVVAPDGGDAFGETMNLASRLQDIAPVGGVVVTERVRQLAGGNFTYRSMGEHSLKGIRTATTPYHVSGERDVSSRFEAATESGMTNIVGREQEIGLLTDRWRRARQGEGQVVLLTGEPGIGKSRVLNTLLERLAIGGAQAWRFQCSPFRTASAFYPHIEHLIRTLNFTRGEPPESRLDKLEAFLVDRCGRPREDVVYLAAMLSIPFEPHFGRSQMSPQRFKRETLRCLADLFVALARSAPSVMLFEDAHWADPSSIECLDVLVERVRDVPLLVIITHRPEFQSQWCHLDHVMPMQVSRLTNAQSMAIMGQLTSGKALPVKVRDEILARSDGVPLFVEELTKSILESGALRELGDRFEPSGTCNSEDIPASLRDSLMARLDRNATVKDIAQIGAVIGRVFSWEVIRTVAHKTTLELSSALNQLTDSGLATCRGTPPDATYVFKHSLVQDVAYDSLLKSRRQELHASIARVLEQASPEHEGAAPELLAHHYGAAGLPQIAIGYGLEAARHASARSAYVEALAQLDASEALLPGVAAEHERLQLGLQLQLQRASALLVTKAYSAPETGAAWTEARRLCDALGRGAKGSREALFGFALYQLNCGEMLAAEATIGELLRQAPDTQDPELQLMAHRVLGTVHFYCGALGDADANLRLALRAYDAVHGLESSAPIGADQKSSGLAYQSLVLHLLGYPDQALAASHAAIGHARSLGHDLGIAAMTWFAVHLAVHRREPLQALEQAQRVRALSEQHGFPLWQEIAKLGSGIALIQLERADEGRELIQQWLAWSHAIGYRAIRGFSLISAAQAECALRHFEAAAGLFEDAERELKLTDERWFEAELYRTKGEFMLARDGEAGAAGAQALFKQALSVARSQGARMWQLRACVSSARLLQTQGKQEAATALLRPIFSHFTEGSDLQDVKDARSVLFGAGS